jgi:beta-lactamase regulating signal transducer with metallopeptidase domain/Leucine-rich repeat (LRR) protein
MPFFISLSPLGAILPFLVTIVLQVTTLLSATLMVSFTLRRRTAAVRHAVLLAGLGAALLVPGIVLCMQVTERGTIDLRSAAAEIGLHQLALSDPWQFAETTAAPAESAQRLLVTHSTSDREHATDVPVPFGEASRLAGESPNYSLASAVSLCAAFLLGIWLVGLLTRGIAFARGCIAARQLINKSRPTTDSSVIEVFDEALELLSLTVRPLLLESPGVSTPMVVGMLSPVILLPQGIEGVMRRSELRNVLIHEIAHVRRRDNLIGLLQRLVSIVWWPHPLVHLLNRRLSQTREEICDNYAITYGEKHEYARTLLQLSTRQSGHMPLAPMVGLLQSRWRLEDRIAGLLDDGRRLVLGVGRVRSLAICGVVITGTLLLAGAEIMPPTEKEAIQQLQSLGASVSGPNGTPGGTERVMFMNDWAGTTKAMKQLKQIHGIKEIWFSGTKVEDVVLEDLPDLERIVFCVNFYDNSVGRQVNWDSLPIKTIRLHNLPKIKSFDRRGGGNNLTETQVTNLELVKMDNLTTLNVAGLHLPDGVLLSVSGAPNLTEISACRPFSTRPRGRTKITDAGLKALHSLKALASLNLDGARITNAGLKTIGQLKSLRRLGLASSQITDDGVDHLAALTQLRRLGVGETAITDVGLKRIVRQHPKLQSIEIGGSAVTAAGLEALRALPELNNIELDSSQLTEQSCAVLASLPIGTIQIDSASTKPGHIAGMPKVRALFVEGAENLTVAPGSLAGLHDLYLRGVGANARRSFFRHFVYLRDLETLEVSSGWTITGAFDARTSIHIDDELMLQVANLKSLKLLWFNAPRVDIGDKGIAAISHLTSLEGVLLPRTQITDQGAASLAGLRNLRRLYIGGTGITNQALIHFRSLKRLRELFLNNTQVDRAAVEQLKADLPHANIQANRID